MNICRHHAFPAIFPILILCSHPDRHRTLQPAASKPTGEARREPWRYFGGFRVWLASVGAGGAVLGLLAAFLIMGGGDAREFGKYPQVYCTSARGQVVTNLEGRRFCAIWIDRPSQSGG